MATTTITMVRNRTNKPLVFSDNIKGVFVEWGKAGAEDGSDVQAVPEEAMALPAFVRLLQREMVEVLEQGSQYVEEASTRSVEAAKERNDQYRHRIDSAREEDPQKRDIVYKVEDSEKQGKVPTYTQVEDETSARPRRDIQNVELGTAAGAGDHDEDGKPTTPEVRVTMGEPLPSES